MTTIAFAPAIRWLWASNPVRSTFRGITACIAANFCGSIRWLAVDQQRDLQLQDVAILAEAKSHQLHTADVARLPIGSLDRLIGLIGRRPFHIFAAQLDRLRIDFVGLLFFHVDKQLALPKVYEQQPFFLRVIDVPGFRRFVIEFYDRERDRLPGILFFGDGLRRAFTGYHGGLKKEDRKSAGHEVPGSDPSKL